MAFISTMETDEQEAARLLQAPVGSQAHDLAGLPVRYREWPQGQMVMLPRLGDRDRTIVVVPRERPRPISLKTNSQGLREHTGSWNCIVVQSDHPSYPVGGYDICVSDSELRRGIRVMPSFDYDTCFAG